MGLDALYRFKVTTIFYFPFRRWCATFPQWGQDIMEQALISFPQWGKDVTKWQEGGFVKNKPDSSDKIYQKYSKSFFIDMLT